MKSTTFLIPLAVVAFGAYAALGGCSGSNDETPSAHNSAGGQSSLGGGGFGVAGQGGIASNGGSSAGGGGNTATGGFGGGTANGGGGQAPTGGAGGYSTGGGGNAATGGTGGSSAAGGFGGSATGGTGGSSAAGGFGGSANGGAGGATTLNASLVNEDWYQGSVTCDPAELVLTSPSSGSIQVSLLQIPFDEVPGTCSGHTAAATLVGSAVNIDIGYAGGGACWTACWDFTVLITGLPPGDDYQVYFNTLNGQIYVN